MKFRAFICLLAVAVCSSGCGKKLKVNQEFEANAASLPEEVPIVYEEPDQVPLPEKLSKGLDIQDVESEGIEAENEKDTYAYLMSRFKTIDDVKAAIPTKYVLSGDVKNSHFKEIHDDGSIYLEISAFTTNTTVSLHYYAIKARNPSDPYLCVLEEWNNPGKHFKLWCNMPGPLYIMPEIGNGFILGDVETFRYENRVYDVANVISPSGTLTRYYFDKLTDGLSYVEMRDTMSNSVYICSVTPFERFYLPENWDKKFAHKDNDSAATSSITRAIYGLFTGEDINELTLIAAENKAAAEAKEAAAEETMTGYEAVTAYDGDGYYSSDSVSGNSIEPYDPEAYKDSSEAEAQISTSDVAAVVNNKTNNEIVLDILGLLEK